VHALLADRAEEEADEPAVPARADDEHVGVLGSLDEHAPRRPFGDDRLDRHVALDAGDFRDDRVELLDLLAFASGKAELRSAALPVLEKVATIALNQPTLNLEISGHADNRPIANEVYPSNWELSAARASRVARYLVEKGVHPSRLAVQGYASHKPRRPNSNVGDRMANRRVEIRLYYSPDAKAVEPQEGDGASR